MTLEIKKEFQDNRKNVKDMKACEESNPIGKSGVTSSVVAKDMGTALMSYRIWVIISRSMGLGSQRYTLSRVV